jgi:hypothetical protein
LEAAGWQASKALYLPVAKTPSSSINSVLEFVGGELVGEAFVVVHIVVAGDVAIYVDSQKLGEGVMSIVDGLKVVGCLRRHGHAGQNRESQAESD